MTTVGQQYTGTLYVYSKLLGALSCSGGWQWRTTLLGTGMHSVVPYQMASVKSEVEGGPVDGEAGSV